MPVAKVNVTTQANAITTNNGRPVVPVTFGIERVQCAHGVCALNT